MKISKQKIKVGYFSVISGFHETHELDDDLSIFEVMDYLYSQPTPENMRGKVAIRAYRGEEILYQWGSI